MAVTALLKFTQGVTVGTPGQALFGVAGTSVQVSNGAVSPGPVTTWTFTVVAVPSGSSVPLGVAQSGVVSTWSFTPDVDGCYLIEITVEDADGNTSSDARCFGIKTVSGRLIPCFLADSSSMNFGGQTTGWDVYMEAWLEALEMLIDTGGGMGNAQTPAAGVIVTADPAPVAAALLFPYAADTRTGAFSFTLPTAPPNGTIADITDLYASWATHNFTIKSADGFCTIQDLTTPTIFQVGTTGTVASSAGAQVRLRYWTATNSWNYA